jgi:hypothetical protein
VGLGGKELGCKAVLGGEHCKFNFYLEMMRFYGDRMRDIPRSSVGHGWFPGYFHKSLTRCGKGERYGSEKYAFFILSRASRLQIAIAVVISYLKWGS